MIPLEANRFVLTWLCVYPAKVGTSKWTRRAQKSFCIFNFVYVILVICTSLIYLSNCLITHNTEELVFMVLQIAGISNTLYLMACIFIQRQKITQMLDILIKIYETCQFIDSKIRAHLENSHINKINPI